MNKSQTLWDLTAMKCFYFWTNSWESINSFFGKLVLVNYIELRRIQCFFILLIGKMTKKEYKCTIYIKLNGRLKLFQSDVSFWEFPFKGDQHIQNQTIIHSLLVSISFLQGKWELSFIHVLRWLIVIMMCYSMGLLGWESRS